MKITLTPNHDKTAFSVPSEYNKSVLKDWLKKYKAFNLIPKDEERINRRRYLEGAVIPAYCEWQYGINARDLRRDEARRLLFKSDFNYEIVTDRNGNPKRSPLSSKGLAKEILDKFTRYAEENGCPIPNPELFKLWRDKWSKDDRFPTFHEFLDFLGLQVDAMPSEQALAKLGEEKKVDYPENNLGESPF